MKWKRRQPLPGRRRNDFSNSGLQQWTLYYGAPHGASLTSTPNLNLSVVTAAATFA